MAGRQNHIMLLNQDFARNGTQQLAQLARAPVRRSDRSFEERSTGALPAAAQFMLLCDREHKLPRRAFRELLIRALKDNQSVDQQKQFVERESVFNDWFYPSHTIPTWANVLIVEIMFGMLGDPATDPKLQLRIRKYLGKVIEEIAGGAELYNWLIRAVARSSPLQSASEVETL